MPILKAFLRNTMYNKMLFDCVANSIFVALEILNFLFFVAIIVFVALCYAFC